MFRYILKRLMIMIPTMLVIMIISFLISKNVPGDPVFFEMDARQQAGLRTDRETTNKEYSKISNQMGYDLPTFYFSLTSVAYPDTLHRIMKLSERECLHEMIAEYGNWQSVSRYYHSVCELEEKTFSIRAHGSNKRDVDEVKLALSELRELSAESEIIYRLDFIDSIAGLHPMDLGVVKKDLEKVKSNYERLEIEKMKWKLYIPYISFHGFENQFHKWLIRMFSLDFGKSYKDRRPVKDLIKDHLPWTIFIGLFSFIIAYLIAIPIGVYSVRNRNTWQDQTLTTILFLVYSVPTFVMAMFLMTMLCNPDYLYIFPTGGIASDGSENWPFFSQLLDHAYHLILPTLVYSYGSIAFLSRQMRVGMLENIQMDYIRTARAKGLTEKVVIWKHAMRNSLLPIITHFATLLPRLVAGAVITETIFSIPGMGRLTVRAFFDYDHPVMITIFTLGGIFTLLGILLADILYAVVDPRIKYTKF